MIETLIWMALAFAVGGFLGTGVGGAIEQRKAVTAGEQPTHEHVWDQWTTPRMEPIYEDDGQVGVLVSQHRTCMACGWIDYRRDSHFNEED